MPEIEAGGYLVTSDECVIFVFRHIDVEKGGIAAEIVCIYDNEELQEDSIPPGDADWWVDDVFYDGDLFREAFSEIISLL